MERTTQPMWYIVPSDLDYDSCRKQIINTLMKQSQYKGGIFNIEFERRVRSAGEIIELIGS